MNIVLLSGGSGKRLWPLSNEIRSKQFLKLFKNKNGLMESMLQRVYNQIKSIDKDGNIVLATSKNQVSSIINQLNDMVDISIEPDRRDTFPAIALATYYMLNKKNIDLEDVIIVLPVDPYVSLDFFTNLLNIENVFKTSSTNIILIGIEPSYPSEKYGYIIPSNNNSISDVLYFKEKPSVALAKEYIKKGALWNGGVFAFKAEYLINLLRNRYSISDYYECFQNYNNLPRNSFDYEVIEKENRIKVMRYQGQWSDLGTWNTLTEVIDNPIIGNVFVNHESKNINIINELDIPIIALGMNDTIISSSPDGILIARKDMTDSLKQYVEKTNSRTMFAEKSWGSFKIIDVEKRSLTILVSIKQGDNMNYHSHDFRDEVWVVIEGKGKTIVDGMEQFVSAGDVITMKAGCRHTIFALTELKLIEIQLGEEISINDKHKYYFGE